MKKIFLAAGLITWQAGFGQQDITFDIQGYLEKKSSEEKFRLIRPPVPKTFNFPKNDLVTSYQNNILILPQDNMPCLTTRISAFNMPNAFDPNNDIGLLLKHGYGAGKMPNVSTPRILTPVK